VQASGVLEPPAPRRAPKMKGMKCPVQPLRDESGRTLRFLAAPAAGWVCG